MDIKIVYQDESILAADKPRGLLTVAVDEKQKNLLNELGRKYAKEGIRLRPINRLDRDTSGIVLFAKTKEAFFSTVKPQRSDSMEKTYLALVTGILKNKTGEIKIPLPSRENPKIKLPARTRYKVLKEFKRVNASLIEAKISAGKLHQIRKHFRIMNNALLMDRDYMDRNEYRKYQQVVPFRHFFLHASETTLTHPITGKEIHIKAPLPQEFSDALKMLK